MMQRLLLEARSERMSPTFVKYHLDTIGPVGMLLHHFTGPDLGDPHDHPWGFTSVVVAGGYEEEIFHPAGDGRMLRMRLPGQAHRVEATTIHRVVRLLADDCWTLVLPEPASRECGFWNFDGGAPRFRPWHQADYASVEVAA